MNLGSIQELRREYFGLIDKCLQYFVVDTFLEELTRAKNIFFESSAVVEENTQEYEARMAQFFDWYFFDYELMGIGLTPLNSHGMIRGLRLDDKENALLRDLKRVRHSLFEPIKLKESTWVVRDLLKGDKLEIPDCSFTFEQNEIFEARLFPVYKKEGGFLSSGKELWTFSRGFCFHPSEAVKFIQQEIKKHRKNPDYSANEMMLKLLKMKYRAERLKHMRIDMIYSDTPYYT
jgi:hypothetical protein